MPNKGKIKRTLNGYRFSGPEEFDASGQAEDESSFSDHSVEAIENTKQKERKNLWHILLRLLLIFWKNTKN